ncbi:MAG TPA: PP2C family serine/threonine-protein phosphatase [Acidimicrobiia bacterium]|nr:PP2C family serine/threonine-protein phosphatase [Acidimicrobiia bacterium]
MSYRWAVASHPGNVRAGNEDSAWPTAAGSGEGPLLVMVADGMGGAVAGEVASSLAVETALASDGDIEQRVLDANDAILAEVDGRPELRGMGTTMTLFELGGADRVAHFAHVGDSRAYLLRGGELTQLTEDHTVVNMYLRSGAIGPDEVANHPQRSLITRAVGLTPDLDVDTGNLTLEPGDRLLLCSDGVNSMIDDAQIESALAVESPEEAAWLLVEKANLAGGHDNITALVVDVLE